MHSRVEYGCWELAHIKTYSSENVYGERRDSEQTCFANLSAWRQFIYKEKENNVKIWFWSDD